MKALLRKGPDLLGKKKHSSPQQSSNFKSSPKTLKRTQDQGHYVKMSNQSQNSYNIRNEYNRDSSKK